MKIGSGMKLEALVLGLILLFIAAFAYIASTGNHQWSGADSQAEGVISDLTGGSYTPWYQSIYEPPSGEIESLLFALQAAVGSLIIGYFLGYYRALAKAKAVSAAPERDGKQDA
jgi:cobalt/nickel transport protein